MYIKRDIQNERCIQKDIYIRKKLHRERRKEKKDLQQKKKTYIEQDKKKLE